jgi:LmbE family N-acetylglucosaminyl deacetylase
LFQPLAFTKEPTVQLVTAPPKGVVLAIAAHPDDIESWCAGTLARAAESGARVVLVLVTSGDAGSAEPGATRASVGARREAEALVAAERLGIAEVVFLRHPDGAVENTHILHGELVAAIRRWRPAALFTHDPEHPWPPYLSHRDHRAVGRATLDAIYPLARDRLAFVEHEQEGLRPHAVSSIWLFASSAATVMVDIAPTLERKIAARLAHESQTGDANTLAVNWRERAAQIGAPLGLAAAETFVVLQLEA